jgi:hypothetical protein
MQDIFHRHFLAVFPNIFFWLVVPVVGVSWGVYTWFYPGIVETPFLWLFEGYLFLMFIVVLYKVIDWYADAWILTERGIIDVRWSLFMLDTTFIEYHDISSIQFSQDSFFDKMFHSGNVTLHKMGDEIHITYMYRPDDIVEAIQKKLHSEHSTHHDDKTTPEMHIYVDGFRQQHEMARYKDGYRYMPRTNNEEDAFVEKVRQQKGTIDLSGAPSEPIQPPEKNKRIHH